MSRLVLAQTGSAQSYIQRRAIERQSPLMEKGTREAALAARPRASGTDPQKQVAKNTQTTNELLANISRKMDSNGLKPADFVKIGSL